MTRFMFMFPTDLGWGRVRGLYCSGAVWSPIYAKYFLELATTNIFTYSLVYCPGVVNDAAANSLLDMVVGMVEGAAEHDTCLADLLGLTDTLTQSGKAEHES